MVANNSLNITSQGVAYFDGSTGFSTPTLTLHAPLLADASNNIKTTPALTNGQLLIGSTGADPVPASIASGSGISVTPGAGSLTIANTQTSVTWVTTSVNVANMAVNTGYICITPGGNLTLGLPTTSAVGSIVRVVLSSVSSWRITQAAGQQIKLGSDSTSIGAGGSVTSNFTGDSVELVCVVANLSWVIISSVGNLTFV